MQIAPEMGSASAGRPEPGEFDAALVVVHGMGNTYKSQILLEWAEPLLERMDWIARDRPLGASRWVIGNLPLVVGIGGPAPAERGDRPVRFIEHGDLDEEVHELIVIDEWPKGRAEATFEDPVPEPPEGRWIIRLDPPRTIRQVLEERL